MVEALLSRLQEDTRRGVPSLACRRSSCVHARSLNARGLCKPLKYSNLERTLAHR
jgi:hypothetical protein